jgi:fermentation-respiration switch protein FrsA (DUF1100 family)
MPEQQALREVHAGSGSAHRWRWPAAIAALTVVAAGLLASLAVGEYVTRPVQHLVGSPPSGLHAQRVEIAGPGGGTRIAGWLTRGRPGAGVVLLLHALRSDRRQMAARAAFLQAAGYTVLLIDLPAHGESLADRITFGANEARGVTAALEYLHRDFPGERVGAVAVSLGAASLVFAQPSPPLAAVVLESMYPTIEEAVADRLQLHLGGWSRALAPILLWQLPLRTGVSPQELRPIDALPKLGSPVLVVSGSLDQHTTIAETQRLYDAAREPRQLWIVPDASHVDLHGIAPATYEAKITAFLAQHLRPAH